MLFVMLFLPPWVSADSVGDQPSEAYTLKDLLLSTGSTMVAAGSDESFAENDTGFLDVVAGPVSDEYMEPDTALESQTGHKPARMKVLTCHVTTNVRDVMRTTYPWVPTETRIAHIAFFEIVNRSDFVKFKITLRGPEFSKPLVLKTLTFGPQDPSRQWGIGFWKQYSVPGLYRMKVTAIPETNSMHGRSSQECNFRVLAP